MNSSHNRKMNGVHFPKSFKAPASAKSAIKIWNGWYHTCGQKRHYIDGRIGRKDGPALITYDDRRFWFEDGVWNREDGPQETRPDGTEIWRKNWKLHREGGLPAMIIPGVKTEWWVNDQRHRINGPARVWADGRTEWYIHGKKVNVIEIFGYEPKDLLTEEEQTLLLLKA